MLYSKHFLLTGLLLSLQQENCSEYCIMDVMLFYHRRVTWVYTWVFFWKMRRDLSWENITCCIQSTHESYFKKKSKMAFTLIWNEYWQRSIKHFTVMKLCSMQWWRWEWKVIWSWCLIHIFFHLPRIQEEAQKWNIATGVLHKSNWKVEK